MGLSSENPTLRNLPEEVSPEEKPDRLPSESPFARPAIETDQTNKFVRPEDAPTLRGPDTDNQLPPEANDQGELTTESAVPDQTEEKELKERASQLLENVKRLPPGTMRLDAIGAAYIESEIFRAELLSELELSENEMAAVALRLADDNAVAFADLVKRQNLRFGHSESLALANRIAERSPEAFGHAAFALRLPELELAGIIRRQPMAARGKLFKSIGIQQDLEPMTEEAREKKWDLIQYPEGVPDDESLYQDCQEAEGALLLALAKERPDQITREQERNRIAEELMGKIEETTLIGGTNETMVLAFEGRMLPAVYKARTKEMGVETGHEVRTGIPPGSFAGREWLAYQIDRALDLGIVPVTVLRDGPEGLGSVQDWKVGQLACNTSFVQEAAASQTVADQLELLAVLDAATVNSDRHSGNWSTSPDGQHFAFDNGFILAGGEETLSNGLRCWALWAVGDRPLSEPARQKIESYRQSTEIKEALHQAFHAALGDDAEELWSKFNRNLEEMLDKGLPGETEWDGMIDFQDKFRETNPSVE